MLRYDSLHGDDPGLQLVPAPRVPLHGIGRRIDVPCSDRPLRWSRSMPFGHSPPRRGSGRARSRRCSPVVERMEARQLLATFTVRTLANAGTDSLRQAILDANAASGPDL